ncbi:MAG: hypothetical protein QNJ73_15025 [Gammaproteobacteria bacterium]|nr:hypothetical protein [Gammaproteobacteria bacterium]
MSPLKIKPLLFFAALAALFSQTALATIISGAVTGGQSLDQGGMFIKLTVPFTESDPDNTVGNNNFQSLNLYGFDEGQNIEITVDLDVDILADGMGGGGGPGIVPMGSTVASHYIFFDPDGTRTQIGTVTFDSEIFGIIDSTGNLDASDFLINTGVDYLNPGLRGLEGGDSVTITGLQTIVVDWRAGSPGDYIRVLTEFSPGAVIPVPAAMWLFGSGLGLLGWLRRKKIQK